MKDNRAYKTKTDELVSIAYKGEIKHFQSKTARLKGVQSESREIMDTVKPSSFN